MNESITSDVNIKDILKEEYDMLIISNETACQMNQEDIAYLKFAFKHATNLMLTGYRKIDLILSKKLFEITLKFLHKPFTEFQLIDMVEEELNRIQPLKLSSDQGVEVDVYGFSLQDDTPTFLELDERLVDVHTLDAVAVVPRHNVNFQGVHTLAQSNFLDRGNLAGSATMLK